jgi:hypothetical protein
VWHMTPSATTSPPTYPFFNVNIRFQLAPSPLGPVAHFTHRNGTVSSKPLHQLLGACDIVLPMVCSALLASSIVDASFHAGVPVVPPPGGLACDAARDAVLGYAAIEWLSPHVAKSGGLEYSGIVRGLIANTSIWPVTGMFPPRLVRAKLRAVSLAYWAGGRYLQAAFEVSLERSLRMCLDVQQQQLFRFVPSSAHDCRKIHPFRAGGGTNMCVSLAFYPRRCNQCHN